MPAETAVLVAAHNESERITATVAALAAAFPGARVLVADDGSADDTAELARGAGADVVQTGRDVGKGGAMTLAARRLLADGGAPEVVLLCDGDLGESAARLAPLVQAVAGGEADLATAVFARRVGGGFGIALGFARWAVERRCGRTLAAPISGQRALRGDRLGELLPFAPRFGMETGMNIDALRAGMRVVEIELELEHRATGRTAAGFAHRARQLRDIARAYISRR